MRLVRVFPRCTKATPDLAAECYQVEEPAGWPFAGEWVPQRGPTCSDLAAAVTWAQKCRDDGRRCRVVRVSDGEVMG